LDVKGVITGCIAEKVYTRVVSQNIGKGSGPPAQRFQQDIAPRKNYGVLGQEVILFPNRYVTGTATNVDSGCGVSIIEDGVPREVSAGKGRFPTFAFT
jgi:hypothetical protein